MSEHRLVFSVKGHLEEVEKFLELQSRIGIEVETKNLSESIGDIEISIRYDDEQIKRKLTRNAGKRRGKGVALTVGEVRSMREMEVPVVQIAEILGVARMTFYRRWKVVEEKRLPDDSIF